MRINESPGIGCICLSGNIITPLKKNRLSLGNDIGIVRKLIKLRKVIA